MKRFGWIAALLLCGCAPYGASDVSRTAPPVAARPGESFPAVQAFAEAAVKDGRVPGIAIAVAVGDQPPSFISAGALTLDASSDPVGPDTIWRIYSMTKPVTAIAAMILIDEGKLRLDQPIGDFIPGFATSAVLTDPDKSLATRPASRPITVRDLMTHTSGLNYAISGSGPAIDALKSEGIVPLTLNRVTEARLKPIRPASLQQFASRVALAGLVADPGTRFHYSMSLDVLAAVVEKAAGVPFETFVEKRLFRPLAMRSTSWQVPERDANRLVTSYLPRALAAFIPNEGVDENSGPLVAVDRGKNSAFRDPPSFPYGGAGLLSTARDYDRFVHMLINDGELDGVRILRPETARLARSNLLPAGVVLKGFGPIPNGEDAGFGAGGFVTTAPVDGFGRHRGSYGWDGAAGSRAWIDPDRRVRVTMMINVFGAPGMGADFDKAVAADVGASNGR